MTGPDATGTSTDDGAGAAGVGVAGTAGATGVKATAGDTGAAAAASSDTDGRGDGTSDAGVTYDDAWAGGAGGAAASVRFASTERPQTTAGRSGAVLAACRRTVARPVPGVSDVACTGVGEVRLDRRVGAGSAMGASKGKAESGSRVVPRGGCTQQGGRSG